MSDRRDYLEDAIAAIAEAQRQEARLAGDYSTHRRVCLCGRRTALTTEGRFWVHTDPRTKTRCGWSHAYPPQR
jgi:hypothetical protein